tara:strand:- start:23 stop:1060 length:1038 start_codon:yes stop_codon:yes gene_type:complete
MSKIIKVAIAGYGIVGKRRHKCLNKIKNVQVIGVCDRNSFENINLNKKIKFFDNYHKLLNENIDALFVCMTNDIAPEVTYMALKKNINVFCEKPPGRFVGDIKKIFNYHNNFKKNLKLMYGFNHRYHDSVIEAKSIIEKNKLGKIINLNGIYGKSRLITFNQPTWRTKRKIAGGGVLLDQGIHMLDLIRYFGGEFSETKSYVSNSFWKFDIEDNAYALLKSKKNIYAFLISSATQWRHKFKLDINLTKGNLILEGILTSSKSYGEESLTIVTTNPKSDVSAPKIIKKKYKKDFSWDREVKYFIDSVIKNKKIINGSAFDALKTMELLYNIYFSDVEWRKKFNIKK